MSLQDAKLARLSRLANLRKASRQHRQALGEIRSEIAEAHHELAQIEQQLEKILGFPAPIAQPVVKVLSEAEQDRQDRINTPAPASKKKSA